jgi:hypothetical protein
LLVAVNLHAVDSDSRLHIGLIIRLNTLPVSRWIAPEWWGLWNFQGLYREHPVGILILPLILSRLGFPSAQAPFLANAIYQVLSLVIVQYIAAAVVPALEARTLSWMLQLIPIAFTYRIRANHEQAVLLLFLVAIWAVEKSRTDARWIGLLVFSAAAAVLVKGVFVVWLFIGCGAWLLIIKNEGKVPPNGQFRTRLRLDKRAWIGFAVSVAVVLTVVAGYEFLYRQVTHESFLAVYFGRQIGAAVVANGPSHLIQKLSNFVFYSTRLLWFSFPGTLAVLAVISNRNKLGSMKARARQAFIFSVGVSLLYVVLFSLSDRRADRYIFPAYYLFASCGIISVAYQSAWFHRFMERWDRHHQIFTPLLWLVLFCLNLASGAAGVPHIAIWVRHTLRSCGV